jgi:murein DD-endopeptidase MepM/ murein hydrolase activator NlpD
MSEARSTLPQIWPVEGVLTSRFGWRISPYGDHSWKFHKGVDLGVPYGTPILDTADGVVVFSGWDAGHGNMVVVDHGEGVATRYCHASSLLVAVGDEVYTGDLLALAGSTGVSTGPHLHYELWIDGEPVDPLPYLPTGG